jgi:23S rRNA pseudouridine1911/1915/1917 synthase
VPKSEFLVAEEAGAGERLDVFLARRMPLRARAECQRLVDKGRVSVDGAVKKSSYKVKAGERIEVELETPAEPSGLLPEQIPLNILYSDPDIVVLDKPSGLVVHPGAGVRSGTLVNALIHHFPEIRDLSEDERPGIVHRLDKETSGVMVVARSRRAADELKRQFKDRDVKKVYLALVWGRMPALSGRFDRPIGRHPKHGQRMSVRTKMPRSALTEYQVRKEYRDLSLLEVRPHTGRTHQIRVHLSAAGHPLAGDGRYGPGRNPKRRFARLFLHAHRLSFRHPLTGAPLEFVSPLPPDFAAVLASLEALE